MSVIVYVNGSSYGADGASQSTVESTILTAIRAGGDFIDLRARDARVVRVLVTAASAIRVERLRQPVEATDEDDLFPNFDFFDTDI